MSQYSYQGVDGAANFFGRGLQLGQNAAESRFQQEFAQQQLAAQEEYRRQQLAERQAELYAKLKEQETRKQANARVLQKILGRGGSAGGMQMSPLLGGGGGAGTPPPPPSLPSAGSIVGLGSGSVGLAPQGALGAGIQSAVMPTQTPVLPALGGMGGGGGGMAPAMDDGIDDETLLNASPEMQKAYFERQSSQAEYQKIARQVQFARTDGSIKFSPTLRGAAERAGIPLTISDYPKPEQEQKKADDEAKRQWVLNHMDDQATAAKLRNAPLEFVEKKFTEQEEAKRMQQLLATASPEERAAAAGFGLKDATDTIQNLRQGAAADSRKAKENEAERAKRTDPAAIDAEVQRLKAMYPEGDINKLRAVVEDAAVRNKREDLPTVNISGREPLTEEAKFTIGQREKVAKEVRDRAEDEYRVAAGLKKTDPIKPPTEEETKAAKTDPKDAYDWSWLPGDSKDTIKQAKAKVDAWQKFQASQASYEKALSPAGTNAVSPSSSIDDLLNRLSR